MATIAKAPSPNNQTPPKDEKARPKSGRRSSLSHKWKAAGGLMMMDHTIQQISPEELAERGLPVLQKRQTVEAENKPPVTFQQSAINMATTGSLNILLFCTPFAIASYAIGWAPAATFVLSLIALAPLAERLGYVTEQLALHTNETIGGLLNATFGNATELIVAITALSKGLFRLVQLSLLGSILSNLLLVLGTAFFFGGMRRKIQVYGTISSQINSTLLMLSTMGILFPTILTLGGTESKLGDIGLSRGTSLILFILYFAYLHFQLNTHRLLYDEKPKEDTTFSDFEKKAKNASAPPSPVRVGIPEGDEEHSNKTETTKLPPVSTPQVRSIETTDLEAQAQAEHQSNAPDKEDSKEEENEEEDEEEEDELGFYNALIWLAAMTALIAVLSDAISSSIQSAADSAGISGIFISAIVLPIVGNAAEHAGAVVFAWKGKLDLSLGVAIGSSTQIALCVLPLLVLIGWMIDRDLDLNFGAYEAMSLFITVVSVTFAIKDGKSNWLIGATLICAYFIIAVGFWTHYNEPLDTNAAR